MYYRYCCVIQIRDIIDICVSMKSLSPRFSILELIKIDVPLYTTILVLFILTKIHTVLQKLL